MSRVTFTTDDDGGVTVLVHPFLLPNALALRSACEYISISSPLFLFLSLLNFISPGAFRKGKWTLKVSFSLRWCYKVGHFEERQKRRGRGERPLETCNRTTRSRWRKGEKSRVKTSKRNRHPVGIRPFTTLLNTSFSFSRIARDNERGAKSSAPAFKPALFHEQRRLIYLRLLEQELCVRKRGKFDASCFSLRVNFLRVSVCLYVELQTS